MPGTVAGTALRVVDLSHFVALKLYAGGYKSRLDVLALLERNPDLDLSATHRVCARFGLDEDLLAVLDEVGQTLRAGGAPPLRRSGAAGGGPRRVHTRQVRVRQGLDTPCKREHVVLALQTAIVQFAMFLHTANTTRTAQRPPLRPSQDPAAYGAPVPPHGIHGRSSRRGARPVSL